MDRRERRQLQKIRRLENRGERVNGQQIPELARESGEAALKARMGGRYQAALKWGEGG